MVLILLSKSITFLLHESSNMYRWYVWRWWVAKGADCQLLSYCLSGPNLPFPLFSVMLGLGYYKLLFLLYQLVSWLSSSERNTGWKLESMLGEKDLLLAKVLVIAVNIMLAKDLVAAADSSDLQKFFCSVFLALRGPVSHISLRGTSISRVAPPFRTPSLSPSGSKLQAPEAPTG